MFFFPSVSLNLFFLNGQAAALFSENQPPTIILYNNSIGIPTFIEERRGADNVSGAEIFIYTNPDGQIIIT